MSESLDELLARLDALCRNNGCMECSDMMHVERALPTLRAEIKRLRSQRDRMAQAAQEWHELHAWKNQCTRLCECEDMAEARALLKERETK